MNQALVVGAARSLGHAIGRALVAGLGISSSALPDAAKGLVGKASLAAAPW